MLDSGLADYRKRNNKNTLCVDCYSKLISIHRWGVWGEQAEDNLKPLGGRIVVKDKDNNEKAVAIISRKVFKGRKQYYCIYKGKKYGVWHGWQYKSIVISSAH